MRVICARCRCMVDDDSEIHGQAQCIENLDRRFDMLQQAAGVDVQAWMDNLRAGVSHRKLAIIRWLLATPQPFESAVHVVDRGTALCECFFPCPPGDWPEGHTWVRRKESEQATCALCKNALARP